MENFFVLILSICCKSLVMNQMQNKVCVVTGATSGIGKAAAIALGKAGADVIVIGRNAARGKRVVNCIKSNPAGGKATFMECDLSSQRQVRELAKAIHNTAGQVDVLVNNAGANFDTFQTSEEDIEMTFATNHLSHFLLTALLLDLLLKAPDARVIAVAGESHRNLSGDYERYLHQEGFDRRIAKRNSKLANLMFTYELSERLRETGITANALHPGAVATRLGRNNGLVSWLRHIGSHTLQRNLISPKKGADTAVYLAVSPEVKGVTGKYFDNRKPKESSPESRNREAMQSLWKLSVKMTSLTKEEIGDRWKFFKP
jgi:NAD(P)-dependent dehydrogenase (short-subunit alcohol dehydrogenase family)